MPARFWTRQIALWVATFSVYAGSGPAAAVAARQAARAEAGSATMTPAGAITLAISGGRLIDGFGGDPLDDVVVLVAGNKIASIGRVGQLVVPKGVKVIDGSGMTIMPGLWESHGHLMHAAEGDPTEFAVKFKERMPRIMADVAKISLMAGITTFRDTGGPLAEQQQLRADIEAGRTPGPRLFLAGPIFHQVSKGSDGTPGEVSVTTSQDARAAAERVIAMKPDQLDVWVTTSQDARAAAERVIAMKPDQLKVYGFWDQAVLEQIVEAAHKAGLGVDADVRHIEAYRTAVKAGVDRLHHVFTADPLSDYSDEDLRLLVRGERPVAIGPSANILRGPYILPTIEMRQAYARALQFPEIVDHPRFKEQFEPDIYIYLRSTWQNLQSIPWGIGARERVAVAKRKLRRFIDAGGREQIVAGCDAGSPLNFHSPLAREIANLAEAGLSPMEAIQAATLRPAQMQGVDAMLGTVSVGKFADIIVVDGDPLQDITLLQSQVVHVIKNGTVFK
jgi:imidazolonepropionase-like amidohydrolase